MLDALKSKDDEGDGDGDRKDEDKRSYQKTVWRANTKGSSLCINTVYADTTYRVHNYSDII